MTLSRSIGMGRPGTLPPRSVTRRSFLWQTALALGGSTLLPSRLCARSLPSYDTAPDEIEASVREGKLVLANRPIRAEWRLDSAGLRGPSLRDMRTGATLAIPGPAFRLTFREGAGVDAGTLRVVAASRVESREAVSTASRYSDRLPGKRIVAGLHFPERNLDVEWRAILSKGAHYIRQELVLKASGGGLPSTK